MCHPALVAGAIWTHAVPQGDGGIERPERTSAGRRAPTGSPSASNSSFVARICDVQPSPVPSVTEVVRYQPCDSSQYVMLWPVERRGLAEAAED
jgi:hypothetical protein